MGMEVVGLGAWCDFVTEDEYRHQLDLRASSPDAVEDVVDQSGVPEPRPGLWRPDADEIEEEIDRFRRGLTFRVAEFATLTDGHRLTLHEERGFSMTVGGPAQVDLWQHLTLEGLESDVLTTVLPDEEDTQDEHPWLWLAERLRALGVQVSPGDLKGLPYEVVFSERLRARIVAAE